MLKCLVCGKEHDGSYGSGRFCSASCASKYGSYKRLERAGKLLINKEEKRICPKCGKEFIADLQKERKNKHKNIYCSRSCANGHVVSEEHRQKVRKATLQNNMKNFKDDYLFETDKKGNVHRVFKQTCCICGKEFIAKRAKVITCSKSCASKQAFLTRKEQGGYMGGGYRKGSGNGKAGWYKGVACQSSYELAWVVYNIDHNIPFKKCKQIFTYIEDGKEHKYYPDFELANGTIIEIKGYYRENVALKEAAVRNEDIPYIILYKKDLKYCFDYIEEEYGLSKDNIILLYDECKGFVTKTCKVCGKEFKTRDKNRTVCSRSCNGKVKIGNQGGRHLINDATGETKIIKNPEEVQKYLKQGWRIGIKPKNT